MSLVIIGLCGQSVFLRVPHFHRPEETLHASALFDEPGGKGYNQAVAAARMGAQVAFLGAVGQDADGERCRARLLEEGVEPHMAVKPGRTAYAAILTDDAGENRVTVFAGAQLSPEDIEADKALIAQGDMLLLTPEIPEAAFDRAVRAAKAHGVRIVINPAPFAPWVRRYLEDAWLLTPNRTEACEMLNCGEDELEAAMMRAPYPRLVVTLGGAGALCKEGERLTRIHAPKVTPVDTTGAGDCLNGVLCAKLIEGEPLDAAAAYAVRAASCSVTRAHVLDAMPYPEDSL